MRLSLLPTLLPALAAALAVFAAGCGDGAGDSGSTSTSGAGAGGGSGPSGGTGGQNGGAGGTAATGGGGTASTGGGGQGGSGPSGCTVDRDCPCGEVCVAGTCALSDCTSNACPDGRTCSCDNGILDIDGKSGKQWPMADVVLRRRPFVAADDGTDLLLRNYHVHDATNMKGIHISTCSAEGWQYKTVTLSCAEINDVVRDAAGQQAGLHMDYIKLDGCSTSAPLSALLEDIDVHDGNVYSLFSDTRLSSLTLRRMKHVNTEGAVQIGTLSQVNDPQAGYFDEVHIEESPDLHVALLGSKIGKVFVVKSPGVTGTEGGSMPILYDAESCPNRALNPNETCAM